MRVFRALSLFFVFLTPAFSANIFLGLNVTLDTSTCVAPKAYETCYATAVLATTDCLAHTVTALGKEACYCADAALQIQCFAEACWNKAYSCEYQSLVYTFLQCVVAAPPVPFWPAPDNAPGSCSCNTGLILYPALVAITNAITCVQNATTLLSTNPAQSSIMDGSCECCMESVIISSFFDICPTTDPNLLGLANFESSMSYTFPWPKCGTSLAAYDCIKDLKFIAPTQSSTTGTLYNPTNLPTSTGTLRPSNIAGQVSSPPSGTSFVWTAIGAQFTIVAAAPEKVISAVTSVTKAGSGAGTTATAAGSGVGSAATTSGSTSSSSGSVTKSAAAMTLRVDYLTVFLVSAILCLIG